MNNIFILKVFENSLYFYEYFDFNMATEKNSSLMKMNKKEFDYLELPLNHNFNSM